MSVPHNVPQYITTFLSLVFDLSNSNPTCKKVTGTSAVAVPLQYKGEVLRPNKITRRTKIQLPSNTRTVSSKINVTKQRNLNCD